VPGKHGEPDAVWLAISDKGEKGDFRESPRLTSFNLAHETMPVYAERIGLDIKDEEVVDNDGNKVAVKTAAVGGFDVDFHGTHVMGIASARKMFANDDDDTNLRGVAPGAHLMSARVCDQRPKGCDSSAKAIVAMSAAGADVINLSLGSAGPDND